MGKIISNIPKWTNKGLATRNEVWWFAIFYYVVSVILTIILTMLQIPSLEGDYNRLYTKIEIAVSIIMIPLFISLLFLYARRYRDIFGENILEEMPKWKHNLTIIAVLFLNKISFGIIPLLYFGLKKKHFACRRFSRISR